jgi:pantoate--beta-alanine ligase
MGALHGGHLELIRAARQNAQSVIVSVFVNPLQFGPNEDLDRYPRTLETDMAQCAAAGVDLVWAPAVEDVYRGGEIGVGITAGPLARELEGRIRPTHYAGVLTVVTKLFGITRPDIAYFGEKDYQQLVLIRHLAHDLDLPVEVVGVPTARESDGLALSSRNRFLNLTERAQAPVLYWALRAGAAAAGGGPDAVLAAGHAELATEPEVRPEYLELRGVDLEPVPAHGQARLLVAARIGNHRLIDNCGVRL